MNDKLKEILRILEAIRDRDISAMQENLLARSPKAQVLPSLTYSELSACRMKLREIMWDNEQKGETK